MPNRTSFNDLVENIHSIMGTVSDSAQQSLANNSYIESSIPSPTTSFYEAASKVSKEYASGTLRVPGRSLSAMEDIQNIGNSFISGTTKFGGFIASLPFAGVASDLQNIPQEYLDAYLIVRDAEAKGLSSPEIDAAKAKLKETELPKLQEGQDPRIFYGKPLTSAETYGSRIDSALNAANISGQINEFTDTSGLVNPTNRKQLTEDVSEVYDEGAPKIKQGKAAIEAGNIWEGLTAIADGATDLLFGGAGALIDNRVAVAEYVAENIPQLASGLGGTIGKVALTTSTLGYGGDVYTQAILDFQKANEGKLPTQKEIKQMVGAGALAGIADLVGDVSVIKGLSKAVKEVKSGVLKSGKNIASATVIESGTEAFQTYQEQRAQLKDPNWKEIYEAGLIGGAVGGSVRTGLEVVTGTATKAKQTKEQLAKAAQEAKAKQAQIDTAVETGDTSTITDPVVLAETLVKRNQREDITEEEKVANTGKLNTLVQEEQQNQVNIISELEQIVSKGVESITNEDAAKLQTLESQLNDSDNRLASLRNFQNGNTVKPITSTVEDVIKAQEGDTEAAQRVFGSYRIDPNNLSAEDATKLSESDAFTPAQQAELKNHAEFQTLIKSASEVSSDIINGNLDKVRKGERPFIGLNNYKDIITNAINTGDKATATKYLGMLSNFADHMQTKAKFLGQATALVKSGKPVPADLRSTLADYGITKFTPAIIKFNDNVIQPEANLVTKAYEILSKRVEIPVEPVKQTEVAQEITQDETVQATPEQESDSVVEQSENESGRDTVGTRTGDTQTNGESEVSVDNTTEQSDQPVPTVESELTDKDIQEEIDRTLLDIKNSNDIPVYSRIASRYINSAKNSIDFKAARNSLIALINSRGVNRKLTGGKYTHIPVIPSVEDIAINKLIEGLLGKSNSKTVSPKTITPETVAPEITVESEITETDQQQPAKNKEINQKTKGSLNNAIKSAQAIPEKTGLRSSINKLLTALGKGLNTELIQTEKEVTGADGTVLKEDAEVLNKFKEAISTINRLKISAKKYGSFAVSAEALGIDLNEFINKWYYDVLPEVQHKRVEEIITEFEESQIDFGQMSLFESNKESVKTSVRVQPIEQQQVQQEQVESVKVDEVEPRNINNPFVNSIFQQPVYHATNNLENLNNIQTIRPNNSNGSVWLKGNLDNGVNKDKVGFYTTRNLVYAVAMAGADVPKGTVINSIQDFESNSKIDKNGVTLAPLYINLQNPYVITKDDKLSITSISIEEMNNLISKGYDGVILEDPEMRYEDIVVFNADQVYLINNSSITQIEPSVTDLILAQPVNEDLPINQQNLVVKGFTVGSNVSALSKVNNFIQTLKDNIGFVDQFVDFEESLGARGAASSFLEFYNKVSSTLDTMFLEKQKGFEFQDYIQFLAIDDKLPENVKAAIALGAYSWLTTDAQGSVINTDKDIRNMIGMSEEGFVRQELRELLGTGAVQTQIVTNMGQVAMSALNIRPKKTAMMNQEVRMVDSLGGYSFTLLNELGWFDKPVVVPKEQLDALLGTENHTIAEAIRLVPMKLNGKELATDIKATIEDSKVFPQFISKVFGVERSSPEPSFKPLKAPSKIKNSFMRVAEKTKYILNRMNSWKYEYNPSYEIFAALDLDSKRRIMGYTFDVDNYLEVHQKSIESRNNEIDRDIEALDNFATVGYGKKFYLSWGQWKNQRIGIKNSINPQTSKLHRFLIGLSRYKTNVDPSNEAQYKKYLVTLAGGFGLTTEGNTEDWVLDKYYETVSGNPIYEAAIEAIINLRNDVDSSFEEQQEWYDAITEAVAYKTSAVDGTKVGGHNAHTFQALDTMATERIAAGGKFTHMMVREVDGITNGVNITSIQFPDGNEDLFVTKMNRQGIYFDDTRGFADWKTKDLFDSYEGIAAKWKAAIESLIDTKGPVYLAFASFLGEINRSAAKSPLMTAIYGAGIKGIINGAASIALDAVYTQVEAALKANDINTLKSIQEAIRVITGSDVHIDYSSDNLFEANKKFKLSPQQVKKFEDNFKDIYMEPLKTALDAEYSDLFEARNKFNAAINLAASMFIMMYNERVAALRQGMDLRIEDITIEQHEAILRDMAAISPIIPTLLSGKDFTSGVQLMKTEKVKTDLQSYSTDITFGLPKPLRAHPTSNKKAVDFLYAKYQSEVDKTYQGYIEISPKTSNKEYKDLWDKLPIKMKEYIKQVWGSNILIVHPDNINKLYSKTTFNQEGRSLQFTSPGVGAIPVSVQSLDATNILRTANLAEPFLGVHDAVLVGDADAYSTPQMLNYAHLKNMQQYSIPQQFSEMFDRVLAAASPEIRKAVTFDPNNKRFFKSLGVFNLNAVSNDIRRTAIEMTKVKNERLAKVTIAGQYYSGEQSAFNTQNQSIESLERAVKQDVKDVRAKATNRPKTMGEQASTLGSSQNHSIKDQYTFETSLTVNRFNVQQVFDYLGTLGTKIDSNAHTAQLKSFIDDVVAKVMTPIDLHLAKSVGEETKGLITATDMYIVNQDINLVQSTLLARMSMSSQEVYAHELSHAITRWGVDNNISARRELNRMYNELSKLVKTKVFTAEKLAQSQDPAEIAEAQKILNYIFEPRLVNGRSNHLHEFVAFARTNAPMREALANIKTNTPPSTWYQGDNFLERVSSFFSNLLDWINGKYFTGTYNLTADKQIDILVRQLAGIDANNRGLLVNAIDKGLAPLSMAGNRVNQFGRTAISKLVQSSLVTKNKSAIVRVGGKLGKMFVDAGYADLIKNTLDKRSLIIINSENAYLNELRAMVTEAKGRTTKNAALHDVKRIGNSAIDRMRQRLRNVVAKHLLEAFDPSTNLSKKVKTALSYVFIKTEMHTLVDTFGFDDAMQLLKNSALLDNKINRYRQGLDNFTLVQAENLGYLMATGSSRIENALLNAYNISRRAGTGEAIPANAKAIEAQVDVLASLYAIKYTDTKHKTLANTVIDNEVSKGSSNGITALLYTLKMIREDSANKIFNKNPELMIKGYMADHVDPNVSIKVGLASDESWLAKQGYVKGPKLAKDLSDPMQKERFIYVNRYGGLQAYLAGAVYLQSDKARGTSLTSLELSLQDVPMNLNNDSMISSVKKAKALKAKSQYAKGVLPEYTGSKMIPIVNGKGEIIDYRYVMSDNTKDNLMNRDTSFEVVMGIMAATPNVKPEITKQNRKVVQALKEQYDADYKNNPKEYVAITQFGTHERYSEIWNMLPYDMKQDIKEIWGGNKMMVRREHVNLLFGYRKYSVTNRWAKDPVMRNWIDLAIINTAEFFFGSKAVPVIRGSGDFIQELVRLGKDVIVIRSFVVTLANTIANLFLLRVKGINPVVAMKDYTIAYKAAQDYKRKSNKIEDYKLKLKNPNITLAEVNLYQSEIAKLTEDIATNPVRDLISQGVLQNIIEDIDIGVDTFTFKRGLVDKAVDKFGLDKVGKGIPSWMKSVASNALVLQGSGFYNTLRDMAQLSDFGARYALYNHVRKQGMSKEDAIGLAMDTFIDYDLPTGVGMQYANDMGLVMFSKYLIRVQKVIFQTFKENPAAVLSVIALQNYFNFGTNIHESFVGATNPFDRLSTPLDFIAAMENTVTMNMASNVM